MSSASEIAIYRSFAEVKDKVAINNLAFDWSLPQDASRFLLPTSIFLDYVGGIKKLTTVVPNLDLLKAFEGKEVFVKIGDKELNAKVINSDLGLFEISGRFFQLDRTNVIYPNVDGINFSPKFHWSLNPSASNNADLYYITTGLNWQPHYNLKIDNVADKPFDPKVKIDALADIYNATSVSYDAKSLKLFAGDANIVSSAGFNDNLRDRGQQNNQRFDQFSFAQSVTERPQIVTQETGGLQAYTYPDQTNILANATTTLPFITTTVKLDRYLEYFANFRTDSQNSIALQRIYTLKPTENLPAGTVTVREDGMLLGQANMSDTPKNENAKLNLGDDFDLRLKRTVNVLEKKDGLLGTTFIRYKVSYSITNTKNRAINVRIKEGFGENYTIESNNLPNFKWENGLLTTSNTLNPGTKLEGTYTVSYKSGS